MSCKDFVQGQGHNEGLCNQNVTFYFCVVWAYGAVNLFVDDTFRSLCDRNTFTSSFINCQSFAIISPTYINLEVDRYTYTGPNNIVLLILSGFEIKMTSKAAFYIFPLKAISFPKSK